MSSEPNLVVMLTHNDHTVPNAPEVFDLCKDLPVTCWGMKEDGLPREQMRQLYQKMKDLGKTTVLEVVAYTEEACMDGARLAAECGCDILMGTLFFDSVNTFCLSHGLKYMPFVGTVSGRPSVLEGTVPEMIAQAREYLAKGAYGIDLLGYRYTGDAEALCREFVAQIDAPVCLAGSINSFSRLAEVRDIAPWGYTIGGAFFEEQFQGTFPQQIQKVLSFMSLSAV